MDNQINFADIFQSNFINNISSISILDGALALGLSLCIGVFIYFVYKKSFKGVMYSKSFSISLIAMTVVTSLIILAITSNVILSLGMVGALSIIRFRTAIKDPMDIVYLFWSIAAGIVIGAGLIPLAIFGSLFIGLIIVVSVNKSGYDNPYLLIVTCDDEASENNVLEMVGNQVKKYVIKAKTVTGGQGIEFTLELRLKDMKTSFVNEVSNISGVSNAVMVSYNGEYMG